MLWGVFNKQGGVKHLLHCRTLSLLQSCLHVSLAVLPSHPLSLHQPPLALFASQEAPVAAVPSRTPIELLDSLSECVVAESTPDGPLKSVCTYIHVLVAVETCAANDRSSFEINMLG